MTPQEAIKCIDDVLNSDYHYDESLGYQLTSDDFEWLEEAKKVLEKQIPKKPILKYNEKDVTPVQYGKLIKFMCPNCGRFVVAMYETDVERGGILHEDLKGCSTCLQAIDFTGYYYIYK